MWKKMIPNTLYTIGIIICVIYGYEYGIMKHQYGLLVSALLIIAVLVWLKINILKQIKNMQRP
jgi:tetrahydromethanopterin S-methyltransferase subunit C